MSFAKIDRIKSLSNTAFEIPVKYAVHNTKFWCALNASNGTPIVSNSYSTGSVIDLAVGRYIVNPDAFTAANTSTIMLGHGCYAVDYNVTTKTGTVGFVGANAKARVSTYTAGVGFVDPIAVSVIASYERIIK